MPAQPQPSGIRQSAKPAALFAKPPQPFKAGDRVRCRVGPAQGRLGTVVRRPYNLKLRVHAGPDQIWVEFDGDSDAVKARRGAIEKVTG